MPTNNPRGAKPIPPILSMNEYVASTNAAIYPGDFVMRHSDGKTRVATAGNTFLSGVAASYKLITGVTVLVYDHPNQQFVVQDDGDSATFAQTDVGLCADILATAGNATFLKSKHTLDISNHQTTSQNLRILGMVPITETAAKYVLLRVVINEHADKGKGSVGF